MRIHQDYCTGCGDCVPFCPAGAITVDDVATVDLDLCLECNMCFKAEVCEVDAIEPEAEYEWPRSLRYLFSDVVAEFENTNVNGRGTEEMKSNDVTGRFGFGEVGISLDMGRPGIGVRMEELQRFTRELAKTGCFFAEDNPVTQLIEDTKEGSLRKDILGERVLSAVIEVKGPMERLGEMLSVIKELAKDTDTVFSMGLVCRIEEDGSIPAMEAAEKEGFKVKPSCKLNVGLGR